MTVEIPEKFFDDNSWYIDVYAGAFPLYGAGAREPSKWMKEKLGGRALIDLGAGRFPIILEDHLDDGGIPIGVYAFKAGCRRYVAIDPNNVEDAREVVGEMEIVSRKVDGLTHLLEQADNSAVIVANGLFCAAFRKAYEGRDPKLAAYVRRLISEIHRVTPSIFFGNSIHRVAYDWIEEGGFKEIAPFGRAVERKIFDDNKEEDSFLFLFEK